jgi:hypothetical protein
MNVGTIWDAAGIVSFFIGFYLVLMKMSVPFFGGLIDPGVILFFGGIVMIILGLLFLGEKAQ